MIVRVSTPYAKTLQNEAYQKNQYPVYVVAINGSVNSKHAHPSPGIILSGICHLVGLGGGEFVRKSLPVAGAFVVPFSIFHLKICLFRKL